VRNARSTITASRQREGYGARAPGAQGPAGALGAGRGGGRAWAREALSAVPVMTRAAWPRVTKLKDQRNNTISRSIIAAATISSPKISPQEPNGLFEVTISEARS
jgi:hypothetical protein